MKIKQVFYKARNVNVLRLFVIMCYTLMKKVYVWLEKLYLALQPNLQKNDFRGDVDKLSDLKTICPIYFQFCDFSNREEILQEAENVIAGRVILFGTLFRIKANEWLCDPKTKKLWNGDSFFSDSQIAMDGYSDVKYVMELNKMYHLVSLARAYYITHEDKYVQCIEQYIDSWLVCVKYERGIVNKSLLDVVFRCINLIHVSFLCCESSYYKKRVAGKVMNILRLSERQIRKFSTPRWCKYSTGANHTIGEMVGLIVMHNWLDIFGWHVSKKHTARSYEYLNKSLSNIITQHGVYLEQSSAYSRLVAEFLILLDVFNSSQPQQTGRNSSYNRTYLQTLLRYVVVLSNNGKHPNFGDDDSARFLMPFNAAYGSVTHIEKYAKYLGCEVPAYIACNESGQFVWNYGGLYLFVRSGRFSYLPSGTGTHAHNDILSVILSYKGHDIFIDRGTYLYNSGMDYFKENVETSSHNTMYVNGIEQAPVLSKWIYRTHPTSSWKKIDINLPNESFILQGETKYGNRIRQSRSIRYCSDEAMLLIRDDVECDAGDDVQVSYLLSPEIAVRVNEHGHECDFMYQGSKIAGFKYNERLLLHVEEIDYFPQYGIRKATHVLRLLSPKKGSQVIECVLKFM